MSGNQLDNIVDLLVAMGGTSQTFEGVDTYADLPLASESTGELFLVRKTTGMPLVNYHSSGWYRSDGATWTKLADYDPTATNTALTDVKTLLAQLQFSGASLQTTVTNLPAVQPVSDNSSSLTVDGTVAVSNFPASQPVTGTFYQATQPVSGTFFQATQPVSLASAPTTPVTGTFFQATQPVSAAALPLPSGAATETTVAAISTKTPALGQAAMAASSPVVIASNQSAVPVSGTFFQATQPVSLASAPTTAVTGTFWQATQPVSGTFFQATQPVSAAALPLPTGASTEATLALIKAKTDNLDVLLSTRTKPADSQTVTGTVTANIGTGNLAGITATVNVAAPAVTKGTQGANGFTTQDLKDAGRNATNYFMAAGVAGTNAEVMQSLTGYKGGAAVNATATPAVVTAGKTYRITSITLSYQSLATAGACLFRLRANTSGTGAVGSPLVMTFTVGSLAAVAGVTSTLNIPFPDGLEFAAGTGIAVGMLGLSTVGAALAAGFGTITIYGYEY